LGATNGRYMVVRDDVNCIKWELQMGEVENRQVAQHVKRGSVRNSFDKADMHWKTFQCSQDFSKGRKFKGTSRKEIPETSVKAGSLKGRVERRSCRIYVIFQGN
ncbi:hypothetical protein Tco_1519754, partial [Tanacetum coccineum]